MRLCTAQGRLSLHRQSTPPSNALRKVALSWSSTTSQLSSQVCCYVYFADDDDDEWEDGEGKKGRGDCLAHAQIPTSGQQQQRISSTHGQQTSLKQDKLQSNPKTQKSCSWRVVG